jgi:hypothetical protein
MRRRAVANQTSVAFDRKCSARWASVPWTIRLSACKWYLEEIDAREAYTLGHKIVVVALFYNALIFLSGAAPALRLNGRRP